MDRFRARLERFKEAALGYDPRLGEDAREPIRSAGVNLFVSSEEFLQRLISFNVWLLASDHFVESRFEYREKQTWSIVGDVLGKSLMANQQECQWRSDGDNTLGVLVRYMSESVEWMQKLSQQDRQPLLRSAKQLPHYASDSDVQFPFLHRELWADADPEELDRYIRDYKQTVQYLLQANLAYVRNSLDHKRDDKRFPSADEILASISRLREAIELADTLRFYPKTYWLYDISTNRFGAKKYLLLDYRGKELVVYGPPAATGLRRLSSSVPYVVAPTNFLGLPDSILAFSEKGDSEYADYWSGYPRRRTLPLQDDDDEGMEISSTVTDQAGPTDQASKETVEGEG